MLTNLPTSRWTKLTPAELGAALEEPVVLAGDQPARFRAGHFTWQVERRLQEIVGKDVDLTTAGYRVITTLDWRAQKLAHRWVTAAVIAPNIKRSRGEKLIKELQIPGGERGWIGAAGQVHPQRGARGARLPDRRRPGIRGQRRLLRPLQPAGSEVQSQVRRGRHRLSPARIGVEAHRLRVRDRRAQADRRVGAPGHHDPVLAWLEPQGRRRPQSRPGPGALRAPAVAQHPGHPHVQQAGQQGPRPVHQQGRHHLPQRPQDGSSKRDSRRPSAPSRCACSS